jgi:hypothetical protein
MDMMAPSTTTAAISINPRSMPPSPAVGSEVDEEVATKLEERQRSRRR